MAEGELNLRGEAETADRRGPDLMNRVLWRVSNSRVRRALEAGRLLGPHWIGARLRWLVRRWVEPPIKQEHVQTAESDWHTSIYSADQWPQVPWTHVGDFSVADIKGVWEPARFAMAFACVRAHASGDSKAPERFWCKVESFLRENPPLVGVHYGCGQEVALRLIAWAFALEHFRDHPSTTPERIRKLRAAFEVGAERIGRHHYYALGQRNNHSLSEAAGLLTAAHTFPDLAGADHWRRRGRQTLERETRELVLPDGTFSQHSVNYQRVALQVLLWSIRLAEREGERFSSQLYEQARLLGNWLFQIQDPTSGGVPRFGPWDGALVLPLTDCCPQDFRPTIQACFWLLEGQRLLPPGPWDEALKWLTPGPIRQPPPLSPLPLQRSDFAAPAGGVYVLRSQSSFALLRGIQRFRFRPGHSDLLHTDVWWRGINVAQDPGTFSYNGPPPFANSPLADAHFHNTLTLDGSGPMRRLSRFLWGGWPRGRTVGPLRSPQEAIGYWEGTHDGFSRSHQATHRRAVLQLAGEHFLVLDHVAAERPVRSRLHWLLSDAPYDWSEDHSTLTLDLDPGRYAIQIGSSLASFASDIVRADSESPRGYVCPTYYEARPAISLAVEGSASDLWWWTLLGPTGGTVAGTTSALEVSFRDWKAKVTLDSGSGPLVAGISLEGGKPDSLLNPGL